MEKFDAYIRKHNPYSKSYEQMRIVERKLSKENKCIPTIKLMFKKITGKVNKRYALPKANEIAAVFTADQGEPKFDIDFTVYKIQNKSDSINFQTLSFLSPHVDPMTYPLLFINGELGWSVEMNYFDTNKDEIKIKEEETEEQCDEDNLTIHADDLFEEKKSKHITMCQFYSFRLSIRDHFSALFYSGKLFQQYAIDCYIKIEANRLNWVVQNQDELRVADYKGLLDYVNNTYHLNTDLDIGKVVILPSSFSVCFFFVFYNT